MSTYLVAFIVGEFDFVEAQSSDGVKIRVYTPLGKKEQVGPPTVEWRVSGVFGPRPSGQFVLDFLV